MTMKLDPYHVPDELRGVEICYQKWISNPNSVGAREKFVLNLTMHDPLASDEEKTRLALTRYHLKLFEFHVRNPDTYGYLIDDLDTCLNAIVENQQTKHLVQDTELARILACLCVERAAMASSNVRTMQPNVAKVLTAWTGKVLTISQSSSVQAVTELLFSSSAWNLLRMDVDNDAYFAARLCELKIPVNIDAALGKRKESRLPEGDYSNPAEPSL